MEMVGDNKEIDLLCTDKSISRISVNLSRSSCGKCSITGRRKGRGGRFEEFRTEIGDVKVYL